MDFRRAGVISNRTLNRGLSQISALRSRLESATCGADVRDAFDPSVEDLRSLVDEANAILESRD